MISPDTSFFFFYALHTLLYTSAILNYSHLSKCNVHISPGALFPVPGNILYPFNQALLSLFLTVTSYKQTSTNTPRIV